MGESEFAVFAKIPRLMRRCVVTEKIDGTNAQIYICGYVDVPPELREKSIAHNMDYSGLMFAGSRSRYITPSDDNFGFDAWAQAHANELWLLGPGRHYGEWWGSGIQRGYGMPKGERHWSLFNVTKWLDSLVRPTCCHVVPVLYDGMFDTTTIERTLGDLAIKGSAAAPGFTKPEGVVVWHEASGQYFKRTLEHDEERKSARAWREGL